MKIAASAVLLVTASLATGCAEPEAPRPAERAPVAVVLGGAEITDTSDAYEAGGVVRARTTAVIASRLMAPVSAVHVRAGDRVRRGQPLITLDARESKAGHTRASATLASTVEFARAAESDIREAESRLGLARASHDRIKTLFEKRSATPQEFDEQVTSLQGAEARLTAARARAAAANAGRDAAVAAAEAAEVGLSYSVLSAPFDSIVLERLVDPGSMATPGAPLLTVENPASYQLEVRLDEARASGVRTGDAVSVRIDTMPSAEWSPARVNEIASLDSASHSFLVKVEVPANADMRSGLFGRARFAGRAAKRLTIPAAAIVRRGQLTFVFRVDTDSIARLTPVTLGPAGGERVEVFAGLENGDRVVAKVPPSLQDGARVNEIAPGGADARGVNR